MSIETQSNITVNRLRPILITNSLANMVRVSASVLVALILPHFLTRSLDHDRFAAWALMLQIAAYASYLDLGLQTAVARYLAQAIERNDDEYRDRLISTALLLLSLGALVAIMATSCVLFYLPYLFPQTSPNLLAELRGGILLLALSAALALPLSTFTGVLIGLARNDLSAISIAGSRLMSAALVIIAVAHTHSLVVLAAFTGGCNLAGAFAQFFLARRFLPHMHISLNCASRQMAAELARYCSTLTIWSFCMLLVGGLDVTIVGHYDFASVGAYSIATMLIAFLTGINNSIYGALLAPLAVLQERGAWRRITNLVVTVTRLTTFVDISAVLVVFLFGLPLLRLWVGDSYAVHTMPILKILVAANAIRLIGAPLSAALVATNQQHYGVSGAVVEGISNFALSIVGAILVGAVGVALGTLVGACISIAWVTAFLLRWIRIPIVSRFELLSEGCLRPVLCLLPIALCAITFGGFPWSSSRSICIAAAFCVTAAVTWRWGHIASSHAETAA
jgi:O-antigen/teichoic acid export membrane protein